MRDVARDSRSRSPFVVRPISLGLVYLGAALVNPFAARGLFGVSLFALAAAGLAVLGWMHRIRGQALRGYLRWAIPLCVWIGLSAVASVAGGAPRQAISRAVWLLFIVPGLIQLFADKRHRRAFLAGILIANTAFLIAALSRTARGLELLEEPGYYLLDVKRGLLNFFLLVPLPFLFAGEGPRWFQRARWPFIGGSVALVIATHGRAGLLMVPFMCLVFVIVEPDASTRVRDFAVVALVAVLALGVLGDAGGPVGETVQRITTYFGSDRAHSDESRNLLLRKAWHLTIENPVLGVGPGAFDKTAHPVTDDSPRQRVRALAAKGEAHNAFAQAAAEWGLPGLFFLVALCTSVMRRSFRPYAGTEARAGVTLLAVALFSLLFQGGFAQATQLCIALLVGIQLSAERAEAEREPSSAVSASPARPGR